MDEEKSFMNKRLKIFSRIFILVILTTIIPIHQTNADDSPLYSWWNPSRRDNFTSTNYRWWMRINQAEWEKTKITNGRLQEGYRLYRHEGLIFHPGAPQPEGTIPLLSWWNPERGDYFATSDPRWLQSLTPFERLQIYDSDFSTFPFSSIRENYRLEGNLGFIYDPREPQPEGTIPLFSWWNPERGDNLITSDVNWGMPISEIRWNGEHIANGPEQEGYRLYRLEGYVRVPSSHQQFNLTAMVSEEHRNDFSRAAIDIESQLGNDLSQINMGDNGYRFKLHGVDSGGLKSHYQGIGILRDTTVGSRASGQRYRRAVLSYNKGKGLMISAAPIDNSISDGVTEWDDDKVVNFKGESVFFDIIDEPVFGNHSHPGGLQAHGDVLAIAMEQPINSGRAAVYFIKVDGLSPSFITSLPLGIGGAPSGLNLKSAAASGFIKLESGYLVAVSGAKNGKEGIWFYFTSSSEITADTEWHFIDFWKPERMPGGICNIDNGKHSTDCYVGAGGGLSLLANNDGNVYLMATTGTKGVGKDDEYAQLYRLSLTHSNRLTQIEMEAVWSDKKQLGNLATLQYSMRWAGAAQTTENGQLILLNTERGKRKRGSRNDSDGILRIAVP